MARKLRDRDLGMESTAADGVACEEWRPSSKESVWSIGETRPGERIRRGSIRPTRVNPDLELRGEFGTELEVVSLESESVFCGPSLVLQLLLLLR